MYLRGLAFSIACALALGGAVAGQERADREKPVFRGIVVKVAQSREEGGQELRKVADETAKRLGGATPWMVRDVRPSDGTFRVLVPPTESSAGLTPAQAWQKSHSLRDDPRVEYAEPAFAVNGAPGETTDLEDCVAARTESGGGTTPIPGAAEDSEWSLDRDHGANVIEAWKSFVDTVPGHDVWIGHPDTGYRKHPEIWGMPNSPIHPELSWDFVDNDDDATDHFVQGTLQWPGHGTRTSSVIVSPRGRQLPGSGTRGVTGVAPGARLIPLRVANGVVLFDQANLASAIRAAAGDDRTLVKQKVDVISISLGGPPSRALEDAVNLAERNGVLVIAAAGNNVKKVGWPARYPSVIALAASNYNSRVWKGSSGGSMVAIGAPGESVWIGNPKMKNGAAVDCLSMSSGTSYATATTAGVAALWISLHREKPEFKALRAAGGLTSEFRRILRATKRQGTEWDQTKFGPGIVDAAAVLKMPLAPPTESASAPEPSRCDRDLAALSSLFEPLIDARARIATLFRVPNERVCSIASLADEIAFLYATSARVSVAVERISSAEQPSASNYSAVRTAIHAWASSALRTALDAR